MKQFQAQLQDALRQLHAGDDDLLHAIYTAPFTDRCDAENVLVYNVGTSAFASAARGGLRFERVFAFPPKPPGPTVTHHYRYQHVPRGTDFSNWHRAQTLGRCRTSLPYRVTATTSTSIIWQSLKRGDLEVAPPARIPESLGVSVTVETPEHERLNTAEVIKPIFDAVVVAFQANADESQAYEIATRLGRKLGTAPAGIARLLLDDRAAVLGVGRIAWPWRDTVQWNPADDRCVAGELLHQRASTSSQWILSGEIFAAEATSASAYQQSEAGKRDLMKPLGTGEVNRTGLQRIGHGDGRDDRHAGSPET